MSDLLQDLDAALAAAMRAGVKDSMRLRADDSMVGGGTKLPLLVGHLRLAALRIRNLEAMLDEIGPEWREDDGGRDG